MPDDRHATSRNPQDDGIAWLGSTTWRGQRLLRISVSNWSTAKEDIDRSRQMYDERIGDDVRKVSNYFYDELVRILDDGKAEALGL